MTEQAAPAIAATATEGQAPAAAPVESAPPAAEPAATPPADAPAEPAKLWSEPSKDAVSTDSEKPKDASTPEWFMKDKYKTIEDQAKAQFDMQKLMGKNWGAPKDDYTVEGIEGIVPNDPLLAHLKPALKELGLSQDGFASLVKGYQDANLAMAKKIEAEVAETLTRTDALTVQTVDKWLQNSFDDADRKTIQSWICSVEDFKLLNMLRTMIPGDTNVPSSTNSNAIKFETTQEVDNEKVKYRKEVAQGTRVPDKNFENHLQQRWKDAYSRKEMSKPK